MQSLVETGDQRGLLQGLPGWGGYFLEDLDCTERVWDAGASKQLRSVATLEGSRASTEISRSKEAKWLKEQV